LVSKERGEPLPNCFFATDLHGSTDRYDKLLKLLRNEGPDAVLLGGDLLPSLALTSAHSIASGDDFVHDYLIPAFVDLQRELASKYPAVFLILGNDDPRSEETLLLQAAATGLWQYIHEARSPLGEFSVYGLAYVPPTPFLLKDWERYDVSRYVPPGSVSPEEGYRSMPADENQIRWATIQKDLTKLAGDANLTKAIFLFHSPPYDTPLDVAALKGKTYEHVPLDPHVGSIAIRRFIEERQPLVALHGHVHESTRLTGVWKTELGRTVCINGAHDGPELALVRFDPEDPAAARRELI
jgi:Icc-related predicted phosphoesterase